MRKEDFDKLLHKLSLQKGEDKLRLSFELNEFIAKLQKQSGAYAKQQKIFKPRATS